MYNHPANRLKQIRAMERAGVDPGIGKWPGDPGYDKPLHTTGKDFDGVARECVVATKIHDIIRELNAALEEASKIGISVDISDVFHETIGALVRGRRFTVTCNQIIRVGRE